MPEELWTVEWIRRPGGIRAQLGLGAGEVADRAQQREGERAPVVDDLVLEQTVVDEREPGGAVGRVDEAAGREGRQPVLVHAAFGSEPAVHDRERAFRVGALDACREREVRAQPVIAGRVVDLVRDAQEALAGTKFERRAHRRANRLLAPAAARAFVADRERRPRVVGVIGHAPAHRTGLGRLHPNRVGSVDDDVVGGRGVVVRVAAVAVVDEPSAPVDA